MNALERLSEICAELPEAQRELSGRHAGFKVRGRTFAYYLDDHRGNEGIVGVVFKSPAAEGLIAASPDRFYKAAYLHHRGWVGLRLDGPVDWTEVADFVIDSYLAVAPKRLAAQLESDHQRLRDRPVRARRP